MRPLLLLGLAVTLSSSALAQGSVYDQIAAVPGSPLADAWASGVEQVLLQAYDQDRSGAIDSRAEVQGVSCEAWQAMQDIVPGGIRAIYGFEATYVWVGGTLGFAEAQRERADAAAARCLTGAPVADAVATTPDGYSPEWKDAVGQLLVQAYDRDGSGTLGAQEATAITCDVWREVENGHRNGPYDRFWVSYGFGPTLIWNASDMGFDEASREAAYADMQACPRLFSDADEAAADRSAAPQEVHPQRVDSIAEDGTLRLTNTQRLDSALNEGDGALSTGEFNESWALYAAEGQEITVEVSSAEFDPYIILKSPSGEQFDNDDWEGSTRIARIVHPNAEEGTWTVLATSYRPGMTGAYGVTLSTAYPSDALTSPSTRDGLVGTTWAEDCPGANPARAYVRLDADGAFAWSETSASSAEHDGADTWEVEGGQLVIRWNDSYSVARYALTGGGILSGTSSKSCGSDIRLLMMP